jgi:hypothetical protein
VAGSSASASRVTAAIALASWFQAARAYLEDHGKPIELYSDKHSVFRTNKPEQAEGGMTQFGRALDELNIDILCANAPQAKGRVERAHKTLQDRLVKELRLAGANDIQAGNALLPAFMADYNRRFAKPARNEKDLHRPLAPYDDLDGSFAWRVERTITQSLTVQYDRVMFILEPNDITRALARKKVTVYDFPDGRIEVRHQGLALPYRTFDRITCVDSGRHRREQAAQRGAGEVPGYTSGATAEAAEPKGAGANRPGRARVRCLKARAHRPTTYRRSISASLSLLQIPVSQPCPTHFLRPECCFALSALKRWVGSILSLPKYVSSGCRKGRTIIPR